MLETKNLRKIYTPKKGVPVTAVDDISLRFPDKGVVCLLGKSGSGKSTLLNLLGGLDHYDSGEIIIKGVSSKDFTQQHFDSYRNTYVGFIFQEYNVLEEFTVGANIALALELQGKSANDEEINRILKLVDLDGFGDRKPNELSGGQKQRVAIARALVKNPEIIMADEPTGALDSNTGRQVLDTLKKLSAEKLVIIVSHDREYAEMYADRIIELADGKVIRDVEAIRDTDPQRKIELIFRASTIEIPSDYHLTEEDRIQINNYIDALKSPVSVILPARAQDFQPTDESKIPTRDGSSFNLIKSVLPLKSAFKIGCSSLKHKRFRLVMTIILSCIAFTLFALVDTFGSYNHIRTCTDSLIDSNVNYVSVNKATKRGSGIDEYWSSNGLRFSESDMKALSDDTGIAFTGLFVPRSGNLRFEEQYDSSVSLSESRYSTHFTHFCGYASVTAADLANMNMKLVAGRLPEGDKNEIAISAAVCDTFIKAGFMAPVSDDKPARMDYQKVKSPLEMVDKVLRLRDVDYKIVGVVDTGYDASRYARLLENDEKNDNAANVVNYLLYAEFRIDANYSLTASVMVSPEKLKQLVDNEPLMFDQAGGYDLNTYWNADSIWANVWNPTYTKLEFIPKEDIVWLGDPVTSLADGDFIASLSHIDVYSENGNSDMENKLSKLKNGETELTKESITDIFPSDMKWTTNLYNYEGNGERPKEYDGRLVGIIKPDSPYADAMSISDNLFDKMCGEINVDEIYDSAVGAMPDSRQQVEKFVRVCYRDGKDVTLRYNINHALAIELDTVNTGLKVLSKIFFYIGIGFAFFAALLMSNFISTSIHYKRREIGILRAIGSRSNDVFRIFFSESFVIAMINFVLSAIGCFCAVEIINRLLRREMGVLITVLHFGIRQIVLLFVICVAVAAIASFLPVRKIASKRPIDAIRDK